MRRLRMLLALGLLSTGAACTSGSVASVGDAHAPTYSRETIRALALHGVHLGMSGVDACRTLVRQGFGRHGDLGCETFPEDDSDDTFLGNESASATPYGKVQFVTLKYSGVAAARQVRAISVWTDEKKQENLLEAATREAFGPPTYYAHWAYRVLAYGQTAEQADYSNLSDYDRCRYLPECDGLEELERCVGISKRFSTATVEVVIFDWGRTIEVRDETGLSNHRELAEKLRGMRAGKLFYACPVPTIH